MRRLVRLVTLLVLAEAALLLSGSSMVADAQTATSPTVMRQAWFWQTAYEQTSPPVAAGTAPATEPSGVPKGDLAVAYTGDSGGASSKMSVVSFDLADVGHGATIDDFTLSLTLDTSGAAASADAAGAPIVACLPTRGWAPADGGDYTDEPTVDCASKVAPTVHGNTLSFKIAPLAQSWVDDQNLGIAFVNDPANTQRPFQAVFTGGRSIKAAMRWTPAVTASSAATASQLGTQPASAVGPSAAGGAPQVGSVTPVTLPPAAAAGPPAAGAAPQVAGTSPGPSLLTANAAHPMPASSLPSAAFWIALAAIAVLVVAASLVLGDPVVSVASTRLSRLDRVLRARTVTNTSFTTRHGSPGFATPGA